MRVLTVVVMVGLLLTACTDSGAESGGGNRDKEDGDRSEVQGLKTEIDDLVNDVGPAMATAVAGEVRNATGRFEVCQTSSDYRYVGAFELVEPVPAQGRSEDLGQILADRGFDAPDTADDRVTAERSSIRATVSERYPAGFRAVKFESDCADPGDDPSSLEDAPIEDYPKLG